jgi:hypothetical protein
LQSVNPGSYQKKILYLGSCCDDRLALAHHKTPTIHNSINNRISLSFHPTTVNQVHFSRDENTYRIEMELWQRLNQEAVQAFHQGDHCLSATKYLESFRATPDKWDFHRWQIMQGYTSVLRENYFVPSDDDLRNVREIANDSKELKLYRCEAAFTYALLSWDRNEREEAAEYYCEVSRLAEKVKKSERRHRVLGTLTSPDGNHPIGVGAKSMGDLLGGIKNRATDNLEKMQAPKIVSIHDNLPSPPPGRLRSDGTPMPESVYFTGVGIGPEAIDLTKEMANHMLSVGGDRCDYCQKTAEEMDLKWLNKCKRCSKAWYCGKDCQLKQMECWSREVLSQTGGDKGARLCQAEWAGIEARA